ncbi:GAF domain-containing protein [Paracidovorax anthurii]|uniref:GAF domain-containing protein n=2 Tax=Paracidovorax anthurii TaxID=78229 RepID=A0A328YC61_9BURK|nr:GAF domain-containing protein [Paracidovorax anthurii]
MNTDTPDMLDMSSSDPKRQGYDLLNRQWQALIADERDPLANLAQLSALVFQCVPGLNWAGFYLLRDATLVLGPFQGKVACTRIPLGRGVCGTCAATRQVQIVPDVHAFPGHIACDSASNAELVLPLVVDGHLLGVFDLDSPLHGRFDADDADGLGAMLTALAQGTDWSLLAPAPGR